MSRKIQLDYTKTDGLSPAVKEAKEKLFWHAEPHLDVRKTVIETEVYREWGFAKTPAMLKAMVFDRLSREKRVWVDHNPLCGHCTDYDYGGYLLPFAEFRWTKDRKEYAFQRGTYTCTDEEMETINKCGEYWIGKTIADRVRHIVKDHYGYDVEDLVNTGIGLNFDDDMGSTTFTDYGWVMKEGMRATIDRIEELKKKMKVYGVDAPDPIAGEVPDENTQSNSRIPMPDYKKYEFYEACQMSLEAMIIQANRYADAAEEAAASCDDPVQKAEWEKEAEICRHVPEYPARTFREALQVLWFMQMGGWQNLSSTVDHAPLRTPQYLYPYYKADKDAGRITDDEVIELFQYWFLKDNTITYVMSPQQALWQGSRIGHQLTLGGLDPKTGEDATNELDYLLLEAQRRIQTPEPLLAVMYHNKLSKPFLMKCLELVRTGLGQPSFHGQDVAMKRRLLHESGPIEDIRNQAVSGCVQSCIPGYTDGAWEARFNMGKPMEFALSNGVDIKTGRQFGPSFGDPRECKTFDEFCALFDKYLGYWCDIARDVSMLEWNMMRDIPTPLTSCYTHDCLERGMDVVDGGARYNWGDGVCIAGGVNVTNSLAAIKKVVYDDKVCDMDTLCKAIEANWAGYEDLQQICKAAPKYGNNDPYVDDIGRQLHARFAELHNRKPDYMGRDTITPSAYSVTAHYPFGMRTWASPEGRVAGATFADATLSAFPGTDTEGPLALIHSATKLIDPVVWGSTHFNMKFSPSALSGDVNGSKFLNMLKTYFDEGGYQIQFNCVNNETLKAAKKDPVQYRDVTVRVAGFSAYFINLMPAVQDEIIARTSQKF